VSVKKSSFLDEEPNYDYWDSNTTTNGEVIQDSNTSSITNFQHYILGTLLVRLVAARGIQSVGGQKKKALFQKSSNTTNPYGEISFLSQTQRTSQIYDTLNPTWPRNEEYYFDVSLPIPKLAAAAACAENDDEMNEFEEVGGEDVIQPRLEAPRPILSVCILHSEKSNMVVKGTSSKKGGSKQVIQTEEQEPVFVGFSSVDLQPLLTGQISSLDQWLPLQDGCGEVRLVCEYEPSDPPPRPGDYVRLTSFSPDNLLFPIPPNGKFFVEHVKGNDIFLSYYTPYESWLCKFKVHRYMVICAERHRAALELYQDQILDLAQQLSYSPIVDTIKDVYERRLPEEGLLQIGADGLANGVSLLARWFGGGMETVVSDIVYAANLDGSHTPTLADYNNAAHDDEEEDEDFVQPSKGSKIDIEGPDEDLNQEALPGMPSCLITGQPMREPVVAGDGHTYERNAITRWLQQSDISPLTGAKLPHKELVPNYLLISALSNAADATSSPAKPSTASATQFRI